MQGCMPSNQVNNKLTHARVYSMERFFAVVVLGGEIRGLDPVLDQFTLQIFGQKAIKILFDARTQAFRDGARIRISDLHLGEHASIQTVLDGTSVYAISIHMLSRTPEGECQGHVQS